MASIYKKIVSKGTTSNKALHHGYPKEKEVDASKNPKFASDYLMGPSIKHVAGAKPVTTDDMKMSDEHKRRRSEIDDMKTHTGRMLASIKYNQIHRDEHDRALKNTKKLLDAHIKGKLSTSHKPGGY